MPDIREILKALDNDDKAKWLHYRSELRRSYLVAHNEVLGLTEWTHDDDAMLDLIDIKLALLFDKAGRFHATKETGMKAEVETIEQTISEASKSLKQQAEVAKGWEQ